MIRGKLTNDKKFQIGQSEIFFDVAGLNFFDDAATLDEKKIGINASVTVEDSIGYTELTEGEEGSQSVDEFHSSRECTITAVLKRYSAENLAAIFPNILVETTGSGNSKAYSGSIGRSTVGTFSSDYSGEMLIRPIIQGQATTDATISVLILNARPTPETLSIIWDSSTQLEITAMFKATLDFSYNFSTGTKATSGLKAHWQTVPPSRFVTA